MSSMTPEASEPTRMIEMVFPEHCNHYGTLFGGHALRMMDLAAFVAATRFTRRKVVTRATNNVEFRSPVKHGQLAEVTASVTATGTTSVTVTVELVAEELLTGERSACAQGTFVFVIQP
ncbi:MAG: acyl-CoA thioesterase [Deltaproteobacteria bacterium]|nr:acyl-CoA thioesterase [Deltaproteobacteria bacterium]